ncbi:MAG: ribonuclease E/G [Candidatus Hydrogenedentota bacterium]|nr:MAG: ribonuclease E/G [Candidatus Hydrogenedentota bacterium]
MNEYVINVNPLETRIALLEKKRLTEISIEREEQRSVVGNIYKGRVDSIVPGIQAAFIDIGLERNGFLYVGDIAGVEGTGDFELEEGESMPRTRSRKAKRPPIENILKKGQSIMVQVQKDTLGSKGVRLTNYVTLPGRYVVLMPTVQQIGVSRKIENMKERDRLKNTLRSFRRNRKYGLIIRTAGEGKPKEEIISDLKYLNKSWDRIKRKMERSKNAVLLHEDLTPVLRIIRDSFDDDIGRLTIDDEQQYEDIVDFLGIYAPHLKDRCRAYTSRRPIFDKFGVEEELENALHRKVMLKSGGHICIDQTEALIAIDVNTGKFTGRKKLEDTVFKTNMEAAEEIAHQMRLRDLGGIIVVDFIDMQMESNKKKLLRKCVESLKHDSAKTSVSDIGELGMVEMTRKRVKHNLVRALSQPCPYCEGSGVVRSVTTMTFDTLRRLQKLFCKSKEKRIILQVHPDVARRLRTENKTLLKDLLTRFDRELEIESVSDFHIHDTKMLSARNRKIISFFD